jgi:hypothetical protein
MVIERRGEARYDSSDAVVMEAIIRILLDHELTVTSYNVHFVKLPKQLLASLDASVSHGV